MKASAIKSNKLPLVLAAIALLLVACLSVSGAMSYFTTYAQAKSGNTLTLGTKTKIDEEFVGWKKTAQISNTGDFGSSPCYIRVKAVHAEKDTVTYSGDGWTDGGDGWWYYSGIVMPGEKTTSIDVLINDGKSPVDDQDFNVVLVYESTILPNAAGTGGDWTQISNSGTTKA